MSHNALNSEISEVIDFSNLTFKKVEKAQIPQLLLFAEMTFRTAYQNHFANAAEDFEAYCQQAFSIENLTMEWENQNTAFWFVIENQQVVGYLKIILREQHPSQPLSEDVLHLERIYVAPGQQGKSIGSRMLHFVTEQARQHQLTHIWLTVWKLNPRAIDFYEKMGFHKQGTVIFQLGNDPQEDWFMLKKLEG